MVKNMNDNIKLYKGDCLEIMKDIPSASIDMILCDLPYGTTNCKWDSIIDMEQLWKEYNRIIKPNRAIVLFSAQPFTTKLINSNINNYKYTWYWVKNNSTGFQNANNQPMRKLEEINVFIKDLTKDNKGKFKGIREYLISERVKSNIKLSDYKDILQSNMTSHYFTNGKQFVLPNRDAYKRLQTTGFFKKDYNELEKEYNSELKKGRRKENRVYNPQGIKKHKEPIRKTRKTTSELYDGGLNGDYDVVYYNYPNNILTFNIPTSKERLHPTQKPVDLLEYLIKTYTNQGETILDNCMGSGSTGVACRNTARKFIGIEKDNKYFSICKNRMNVL